MLRTSNWIDIEVSQIGKEIDLPFDNPKSKILMMELIKLCDNDKNCIILDFFSGFRVIIMTQANSQVNTRVLELLPKFKIKKMNRWCAV